MNDMSGDCADRLTTDALHLAISLDSFTTLDWVERLGPAIRQANEQLARLLERRELLRVSRADDAIIDWTLEIITTRLKFLELLHSRNSRCVVGSRLNWIETETEEIRVARG